MQKGHSIKLNNLDPNQNTHSHFSFQKNLTQSQLFYQFDSKFIKNYKIIITSELITNPKSII